MEENENPVYAKARYFGELAYRDANGEMPSPDAEAWYLCGPMSGIPSFNFPNFDRWSHDLRRAGILILSPAELDDEQERAAAMSSSDGYTSDRPVRPWSYYLVRDLMIVFGCAGVVCMDGWRASAGGRLESFNALQLGKHVVENPRVDGLGNVYSDAVDLGMHPYQTDHKLVWGDKRALAAA